MSERDVKALLLDGDALHGVSLATDKRGEAAGAAPVVMSWAFRRTAEEGDDPPPLADAFRAAAEALGLGEGCPLALPPDILVTRVLSLPATDPASLASMARLAMEKFAPVSDDDLEVAYEVTGATETSTRVFAVAVPRATLDALADALAASGLVLTRLDSSLLCEWESLASLPAPPGRAACHAAVFAPGSGRFDLVVADASGPLFARTLGSPQTPDDLARELSLSLLDLSAEADGAFPGSIALVARDGLAADYADAVARAAGLKPTLVREDALPPYAATAARREMRGDCIDIVPSSWRAEEKASILRGRFRAGVVAALALWALLAGALFLAPKFIARQTARVDREIAAVEPAYREVAGARSRVRLIRSYEDRSHSLLDVLRTICAQMPDGMTFASISYEKGGEAVQGGKTARGGVKIAGDAEQSGAVLTFKDALDGTGLFQPAKLTGPTMDGRRQRYKFEVDSRFAEGGRP